MACLLLPSSPDCARGDCDSRAQALGGQDVPQRPHGGGGAARAALDAREPDARQPAR